MLGVVTSLRAKELALDWSYHVWLLDRAVASMLAVEECETRVFIVCHEIPDSEHLGNPRVQFESLKVAQPKRNNDEMCADKVVKLSAGARIAVEAGCAYVLVSDADDLLSSRVGRVVAAGVGEVGWYSPSELFYRYGSRWLRFYRLPPGQSGPCAIFRADLLEFECVELGSPLYQSLGGEGSEHYASTLVSLNREVNPVLAAGHTEYRGVLRRRGIELLPLPFSGNVVICHQDSTSRIPGGLGSAVDGSSGQARRGSDLLRRLRRCVARAPALRLMTRSLAREFHVPSPGAIPRAYRASSCAKSTSTVGTQLA